MYGPVLAQFGGRARPAACRSPLIPIVAGAAGRDDRRGYVKELVKLGDTEREKVEEENQRIREKTYELAADPQGNMRAAARWRPRPP